MSLCDQIVKFRQFADVKDAAHQGLSKGDTFHWNVYSTVATGGAILVENTAIAETNFTITQGTMSISEYGNSVPFTSKLDDLSEHPVKEIIHKSPESGRRASIGWSGCRSD